MKFKYLFFILTFLVVSFFTSDVCLAGGPRRVVSLAPNITEIIFAIGAGDRLVGVTSFCHNPPQARNIKNIGGYLNPNIEAILKTRPDLVIATPNGNNKQLVSTLSKQKIPVLVCITYTLDQIFETIRIIGGTLDLSSEAARVISDMEDEIKSVKKQNSGTRPSKVVAIVGQKPLIVVGKGGFLDKLIEIAGGENIVSERKIRYPLYSYEELISAGPEVIIDLSVGGYDSQLGCSNVLLHWQKFTTVPAVRNNRVHCISDDALLVPGPRAINSLPDLVRLISPSNKE